MDGIIENAGIAILAGVEVENLQWRRPVKPGDVLNAKAEIVGLEEWNEEHGIVQFDLAMQTDEDDLVLQMIKRVLVDRR
ncbi:hypothetical protein [Haladaptatus pallidirubidus]|uniref:hypothetical protein n=1 Tax=Haladaptatus pallidirubidus TaxID=1008152 RepID=UPI0036F26E99